MDRGLRPKGKPDPTESTATESFAPRDSTCGFDKNLAEPRLLRQSTWRTDNATKTGMRHPETEERPGDTTTAEQANSVETTPNTADTVQIHIDMTTAKSERIEREKIATKIAQRHRVRLSTAHSAVQEALLSEMLVPAGNGRVSLNPALFGQTWDEWSEHR